MVESEDENIGKVAEFATLKLDGNLFWGTGIYEGKDETHFYFKISERGKADKTTGVLRNAVVKINFMEKEVV